jgi:hypothetical protein
VAAVCALLACTATAAADELPEESPSVAWSVGAGVVTALLPMAIGGGLFATDSFQAKMAGTYVLLSGLALAPVVSHGIAREWGRAAVFGALPTAALLGMVWLLEDHPLVLVEGNKDDTRVAFYVLMAASVMSSAGGLVDSFWAPERAAARRVTVVPLVGRNLGGLAVGGAW